MLYILCGILIFLLFLAFFKKSCNITENFGTQDDTYERIKLARKNLDYPSDLKNVYTKYFKQDDSLPTAINKHVIHPKVMYLDGDKKYETIKNILNKITKKTETKIIKKRNKFLSFEAVNKLARLFISDIFNKIDGGKVFKFGKTINPISRQIINNNIVKYVIPMFIYDLSGVQNPDCITKIIKGKRSNHNFLILAVFEIPINDDKIFKTIQNSIVATYLMGSLPEDQQSLPPKNFFDNVFDHDMHYSWFQEYKIMLNKETQKEILDDKENKKFLVTNWTTGKDYCKAKKISDERATPEYKAKVAAAKKAEEERLAREAKKAEEERLAKIAAAKKAEEERLAKIAEEKRQKELARKALIAAKKAALIAAKKAEEARKAAEEKRRADAKRKAAEEEARRKAAIVEARRKAVEKAKRIAAELKRKAEELAKQKADKAARLAAEKAARLAAEKAAIAEAKRKAAEEVARKAEEARKKIAAAAEAARKKAEAIKAAAAKAAAEAARKKAEAIARYKADGLYSLETFTFTNCGKNGNTGPTLTQCRSSYSPEWTKNNSYFNMSVHASSGIQLWTVPRTAKYIIDAYGAQGGNNSGGSGGGAGARMKGTFSLTKGDKYMILVGQMGSSTTAPKEGNKRYSGSGGGGGTFVVKGTNYNTSKTSDVLIVAGGAGGSGALAYGPKLGHNALTNPNNTTTSGGEKGDYSTGGGAGFNNNGVGGSNSQGLAFTNGGKGGVTNSYNIKTYGDISGGFGGGGAAIYHPGGGGGGYNGGKAHPRGSGYHGGHGGGSRNNGTNQINNIGTSGYHGRVIITLISTLPKEKRVTTGLLYLFKKFTFTNCNKTGRTGPTLVQCRSVYKPAWAKNNSYFNMSINPSSGIQLWTVPRTGKYIIDAYGAKAGDNRKNTGGGKGARMKGTFSLIKDDKYMILIGQMGGKSNHQHGGSGGGGGTFIVKGTEPWLSNISDVLIVAAGGGGAGASGWGKLGHNALANPNNTSTLGGKEGAYKTGGGGSFDKNGSGNHPGVSFMSGGRGGTSDGYGAKGIGGFGGGGGISGHPGGGGGGYTGGNAGYKPSWTHGGYGGGSRNNGTKQTNTAGYNNNHGKVIISFLPCNETLSGTKGNGYRGCQTKTSSGKTCMNWSSQSPHKHINTPEKKKDFGIGNHNYCRNPDGEKTIWCYTTDKNKRWENCAPIKPCNETLSGTKGNGYRGCQTKTSSGKTCMNWSSQSPHKHINTPEKKKDFGIGNHNYCRNPDGEKTIWCYTTDKNKRWENCAPIKKEFTTFTFTNCGVTGRYGPTLAQCKASYSPSWTDNTDYFNVVTQGIQIWTVPTTGKYEIEVWGASGGQSNSTATNPGRGQKIKYQFSLSENNKLHILVGQQGETVTYNIGGAPSGGGGGGTFVILNNNDPLIIAGGGNGNAFKQFTNNAPDAQTTYNDRGTPGNGGRTYKTNSDPKFGRAAGGGGYLVNGINSPSGWHPEYYNEAVGKSYANGGVGGNKMGGSINYKYGSGKGGFGGGGGTQYEGGGGGGYVGGDVVPVNDYNTNYPKRGSGSFIKNVSSGSVSSLGLNVGHGKVIITFLEGFTNISNKEEGFTNISNKSYNSIFNNISLV